MCPCIVQCKGNFLRAVRLSNQLLLQGYVKERLKLSLRKFYDRYRDLIKQYEVPFSRMLHHILEDDNIQRHPPLIRLYQFWPCYRVELFFQIIAPGFHRTFATDVAFQQRMLTPLDTLPCPSLGLACVFMLRPISPELVMFPDFWVSNIPWYFYFTYAC